jgi:hypothetical protein
MNRLSILSNAKVEDLVLQPYPHLLIRNALDRGVFEKLQRELPPDELVVDGRTPVQDTWYDYPACRVMQDERVSPLWREFFAYHTSQEFFRELLAICGNVIRATHPRLEAKFGKRLEQLSVGMRPGGRGDPFAPGADVSMECQFYANYTRRQRAVRGPHVDRPTELFAALLYFRQPGDDSTGGDLQICESIDDDLYPSESAVRIAQLPAEVARDRVRTVRTARYEANTLVLFINSPKSIHSVSVRSPTPVTRRHINFCCDVRRELFEFRLPPRLRLKQRLEHTPVAWRLARWV